MTSQPISPYTLQRSLLRNPSLLNHVGLRRHAKLKVGLTLSSMKFDWARQVGEERGGVGGVEKAEGGSNV